MRFMMMVKADKDYEAGLPPTSEPLARGLLPSSAGSRVQASGGKLSVTDGPFTETKELLGGHAIVEAKSREEAVEPASGSWRCARGLSNRVAANARRAAVRCDGLRSQGLNDDAHAQDGCVVVVSIGGVFVAV
jgi:hypothetical protein